MRGEMSEELGQRESVHDEVKVGLHLLFCR